MPSPAWTLGGHSAAGEQAEARQHYGHGVSSQAFSALLFAGPEERSVKAIRFVRHS